jgi:hypothetical protein
MHLDRASVLFRVSGLPHKFNFVAQCLDVGWNGIFLARIRVEIAIRAAVGTEGNVKIKGIIHIKKTSIPPLDAGVHNRHGKEPDAIKKIKGIGEFDSPMPLHFFKRSESLRHGNSGNDLLLIKVRVRAVVERTYRSSVLVFSAGRIAKVIANEAYTDGNAIGMRRI